MSSQSSERTEGVPGADLIVVGGGVIGLSCAWRAAREGADVLVVDAGPRERATPVAAGMIAPVGEASWGEERLLRLGLESADAWPGWAEELAEDSGIDVPYRLCGAVHAALDRDELEELRRVHGLHEQLGLGSEWKTGSGLRGVEPGLSTDTVGGFVAPGEAEIDPRLLLVALRAAAEARGVRFLDGVAARILIDGDAVAGLSLAGGVEPHAGRVLVANGARAGELLPEGSRVPVRPVKGEVVRLRAPNGELPCERIVVTERIYVVPRGERPGGEPTEVVLGATVEDRGFDTRVTAGGVHELLREAYRALPEIAELELAECVAGLRPGSPDNAPAIGWGAEAGLLVAVGHYRNGILLAPATGAAIADLLAGRELSEGVAALGPERFWDSGSPDGRADGKNQLLGSEFQPMSGEVPR